MSKTLEPCPNFIGGEWIESTTARTPVFNPSIGEVISECPVGNVTDANAAVEAVLEAIGRVGDDSWRPQPLDYDHPAIEGGFEPTMKQAAASN